MYISPFHHNYISIQNPRHLRFSQTAVYGPAYNVASKEMNILKTFQRLAATTKMFSGKQKFVKF